MRSAIEVIEQVIAAIFEVAVRTLTADRRRALSNVTAATLVIHGEADPMIRSVGGKETARAIPGSQVGDVSRYGHDWPRQVWPSMIGHMRDLVERTGSSSQETDQSVC